MAETLKVPGLGDVPKKYVIGGVVVGGGVAVIVFIRARSAAKQSAANAANQTAAQASGTVTDPAGNTCAALDPNSGYCPGSPEDQEWQEENSGYYSSGDLASEEAAGEILDTGTGVSTAGLVTDPAGNQCSAVDPATGYCPGTPQDLAALAGTASGTVPSSPTSSAPTTNSAWLQDALTVLPGGDSSANEAALAGVLGGLTVTTAQKNIFLEAVGLVGQPPGGYPTPIKTSDTSAQPGSPAKSAGPVNGLTLKPSGTGVQAKWSAATNATGGYHWVLTGPQNESGNTTATTVTIHGLKKGAYKIGVQGLPGGVAAVADASVG
jgi:hypothetical protein